MNTDKSRTRSGLAGQSLAVLDLKMSCGGSRHFVGAWSRRNELKSVVVVTRASIIFNKAAVEQEHDKKSAGVRQVVGPTNFDRFDPVKKSPVLRGKIG